MANSTLIVGYSGTGKTTSAENLPPEETVIISLLGKELPFSGWQKNYLTPEAAKEQGKKPNFYTAENGKQVIQIFKGLKEAIQKGRNVKNIFIDDGTFAMTNDFMARIDEEGWDKWKEMAHAIFFMVDAAKHMPNDIYIFFTWHPEIEKTGNVFGQQLIQKARTLGKLFDEKIGGIEPLFTTVLYTHMDHKSPDPSNKYFFMTQGVGNTAKSPKDMFGRILIPNDLKLVKDRMIAYGQGKKESWDVEFNTEIYSKLTSIDSII
jgi:predicted peroxiredoxin